MFCLRSSAMVRLVPVEFAVQQMASAGYEALHTHTDWVIDGAHVPEMHFAMVEGVAVATLEQAPTAQVALQCWRARRNAGIRASRLRVGYVDIVATPG